MKKITSLLVVLMMLVSLLSLTAFAALEDINEETCTVVKELVLKGTPTIDGKLDKMYTESMTLKLHGPASEYFISGGSCEDTTSTGTVYAMYDDNYVYVFFHVVDNTLIQADPEYIEISAHPHLSDAVEVRVGDDLEDHFAPYDGSNDAHHLFYADAHGVRFTCYEDSMGDDVEKLKSKAIIDKDGKTYYVELAIPTQKPFQEGEIIEFEFQIDDLQDDMDSMCAVGSGYPHHLVQFLIGGNSSGATASTEQPKAEEPKAEDPKVEEPKVEEPKVEEPKVEEPKVEEPKVEEPKVEEPKVEEPKVEEPKEEEPKEEEPKVEEPTEEVPGEEVPGEEVPGEEVPGEEVPGEEVPGEEVPGEEVPGEEEPKVEEPKEEEPKEEEPKVEEPKEEEPKAEEPNNEEPKAEEPEKSNTGLIVGIVIAVVVVVAIVAVVLKKKK